MASTRRQLGASRAVDNADVYRIWMKGKTKIFSCPAALQVLMSMDKEEEAVQKNFSFSAFLSEQKLTDGKTDRKTERLFSLVIKTKVVHNVNRMSES